MALRNVLTTFRERLAVRVAVRARGRLSRGVIALLAVPALLLPALLTSSPAIAAPQTTCSQVYFFGAHGVNEPQPGGPKWGPKVDAVWKALISKLSPNAATGIAANYPESVVNFSASGPTIVKQVLSLPGATNNDAAALAGQMWNTYLACPDSSFVLAGYSQGAWAIDKALRTLSGDGPVGKGILADTKGVFLMGDPAWANSNPKQLGVASTFFEGYNATTYLANGIPTSHFFSICAGQDPICNYKGVSNLLQNISVHVNAYTAGNPSAAADGGYWLATKLSSSPPPAPCTPKIDSVGPFQAAAAATVEIVGSCFGTGNTSSGGDTAYFRISDLTAGWNACWTGDPNTDQVTCNISAWTNTSIIFSGFSGAYGQSGWVISNGDQIEIQVWNPQSGKGPATCQVIAGSSTPTNC